MLEHLGVYLALLNDEGIRVISISSHLLPEHPDHVVIGAGTFDITKETIKFSLTHENTIISHLLLEHLDHVVVGAGARHLGAVWDGVTLHCIKSKLSEVR